MKIYQNSNYNITNTIKKNLTTPKNITNDDPSRSYLPFKNNGWLTCFL